MDTRSDFYDRSHTLVTESLVNMAVVLICKADTAVRDLDKRLRGANLSGALGFNDISRLGALKDSEFDRHGVVCAVCDKQRIL